MLIHEGKYKPPTFITRVLLPLLTFAVVLSSFDVFALVALYARTYI